MTQQPFNAASLRGAVDLSRLASPSPAPSAGPAGPTAGMPRGAAPAGGAPQAPAGLVIEGTDANFTELMNATVRVPAVLVLWASQQPETRAALDLAVDEATRLGGRLQVISVDAATTPGVTQALAQALQLRGLPFTLGLVGGQPVPMYEGVPAADQVGPVFDELVQVAAQQGVTGRVELGESADAAGEPGQGEAPDEPALPPLHQQAFDAIEAGDLDGAHAAYEQALADNPADEEATLGLAQVGLLRRTQGVDLQAARAAAAADPTDVEAQITVADLDLLGGHVEDAFTRLIDLVRVSSGDERERARTHLLELFSVIGSQDERVRKGRTALMSALF
ncbi:MAG: tetratricopeptide repeat protein [Micrococcales bacterium]|nr:tetratricopeptide repeat protein [Micrococcales bacterium]